MFGNSLINGIAIPASSFANVLAPSHAAMKHLITVPYHLMVAISGVYSLRWECKAVRQPFLPQFLFIQNSDLTKSVHKENTSHICT